MAYIKVNISRSRKALSNQNTLNNDVRLSILADVGNTSFVYDMRNIKEVFVFPKIWYRRSLVRRVFLGEEPINVSLSPENKQIDQMIKSESSFIKNKDFKRRKIILFSILKIQIFYFKN